MTKTALIGEFKLLDGWHFARVFDTPTEAVEWRNAVGGSEHARRTRRVLRSSETYSLCLEAQYNEMLEKDGFHAA